MRPLRLALLLVVTLIACRSGSRTGDAKGRSVDAGEAAPQAVRVTPELLDRYVGYQKALVPVYAALTRTLDRAGEAEALGQLKKLAAAEERAREEAGLSSAQVEALEALVSDVLFSRKLTQSGGTAEAVQKLEALAAQLPAEQQPGLARAVTDLKAQQQSMLGLEEARKRHGAAPVDWVLAREDELVKSHAALMAQFAEKKR